MYKKGIRQKKCLFTSILVISLCLLSVSAYSQEIPVTLAMKNVKLSQVMREIEKQTKLLFVYTNDVDRDRLVSVSTEKKPLKEALNQILNGTNLTYQYEHPNIILSRKPAVENQPVTLSGTVKDNFGLPLGGATVVVSGTQRGASTNTKGEFNIQAAVGDVLTVSYVGYVTGTVTVLSTTAPLTITLQSEPFSNIDEVVVIGYGTSRKSDLTGSVTNVRMADIKGAPLLSVDQALQGRVAGADIMSTTGEPGAETSIRIRGTRSITASNEPLIVVDGVMDAVSSITDINPDDIESISILKDASSTAIYGSRGSNGVIILTTKKGASPLNKPNITLKAEMGFSKLATSLDVMDAAEFGRYYNDYVYLSTAVYTHLTDQSPLSEYRFEDPLALGKGTNWVDEITRVAPYQNYNLSISGSGTTPDNNYFASVGYNDTRGIIQNSGQSRLTARLNLNYKLLKWLKVGLQGSYTFRDQDATLAEIGGTAYYQAAQYLSPLILPTDDFNPYWGNGQKINTPRVLIDQNTENILRYSQNYALTAEIQLAKNLKLRSQLSYYNFQRHHYRYYPSTLPRKAEDEGGEAYRQEYDENSLNNENTLTYNFSSKSGHTFDVLGGFTAYSLTTNNFTLSGKGYMDDDVKWNNMNAVTDKETYSASSSMTMKTRMSALARFNYNYKSKYYITLTGRYDGASNFAANNKWGFFPSAALKWNIAKEPFMRRVRWIDEMSIRVSAGRTGNDAISSFRSIAAMSSTTGGYLFDGKQPAAYYPSRLDSPDLTWEKTDLYNLGIDLSLLRNRLGITFEAYTSYTRDLLLTIQTASQTGYTTRFANLGKTSNKGVELTINSFNITNSKFTWNSALTVSHNVQKVLDIGTEDFVTAYSSAGNNPYMMYGYVKGYPLNSLWGFKYGGTWKSVEEFDRNDVTKAYASATTILSDQTSRKNSLGLPRYHDINRDGTLSQEDLVYMGTADPWLYGGLQNNFTFGPFNLGVYFTYSLGGKIYNYSEMYMSGGYISNQYRYMIDSWHPVRNPYSDTPKAGAFDTDVPSDRQIHDASYVRFKSLSFSYRWNLSKKTKLIRDVTFGVNADNLWIWKKYNGFDPDVSTSTESTLRRVDLGAYPKSRTVVFSIQVRY